MERTYCTLLDLHHDLDLRGLKSETQVLDFIRAASMLIEAEAQNGWGFIPQTAQKSLNGSGEIDLYVPALLAITAFTFDDGAQVLTITSADYVLYPRNKWWANGPYTRLEVDVDSTQIGAWVRDQGNALITGRWGLYEESRDTGATLNGAHNASVTTLNVSDASALSLGAVLLVDTEQMQIEGSGTPSDSTMNTAEALDNAEEEVDVDNAALINAGEIIRIDYEKMRVIEKVGNTLVVQRGWAGSKIATHSTSADVYVYRAFTVKRGVNGTTAASHSTAATIYRYLPPSDINYLCRQMVGLMLKKAGSGWAGKIGNAALGEVFYVTEFPKEVIQKVTSKYETIDG